MLIALEGKTSCCGGNNKTGALNLRPPPSMAPNFENKASFEKPESKLRIPNGLSVSGQQILGKSFPRVNKTKQIHVRFKGEQAPSWMAR